ncbi:metallophosphoesterase family protein [Lacticaseibacillus pantheris]|uniref:metallophosphoesterase family protein n=1 Tax=Lacticaseibacillus pantheris TaxID=171523 RepID=UPI0006CFC720|nr:metallophosphoesterase [Lacticaseibacillus pantheris]
MATKEQRIAIIGDVHGNFGALTAALADAEEQHVTDYIVLGDITNRGPEPERCLRALRQLHPLAWVLGNHEEVYTSLLAHRFTDFDGNSKAVMAIVTSNYDRQRMTADEFRWLAARPLQQNVTVAGVRVSIFHATPDKCRGHYTEPTAPQDHFDHVLAGNNADLAFCGHTHQPVVRRTTDGRYVINPGSVGQSTPLGLVGKLVVLVTVSFRWLMAVSAAGRSVTYRTTPPAKRIWRVHRTFRTPNSTSD